MNVALLIADDARERQFLLAACQRAGYQPVAYPNPGAYLLDLRDRRPALTLIRLTLPLDVKLTAAAKVREHYPDAPLVLIGKTEFLAAKNLFQDDPHTILLTSLDELALTPAKTQ